MKEKRKSRKEREEQENSGNYIIYERPEQRPLDKLYSKMKEFKKYIPVSEKDIANDIESMMNLIKQCAETQRLSQIEKMMKGMKRIGDREDIQIGSGLLRAKLSNVNDMIGNLNVHQQDQNRLTPNMSEQDDEQQYYSDIQKRNVSTNGNGSRGTTQNRQSLNREVTLDPIKLSKYLKDYNKGIELCLEKLDLFEFDIFSLRAISNNRELLILGYEIAQKSNLIDLNKMSKFVYLSFLQGIAQSYNSVYYHNKTHAGDVLQGLHYFLHTGKMSEVLKLTPLEHIGAIVAAISHDVDHPGFNNSFLVSTKDEIALLYNDQSVLENHHVAQTFLLLRSDELNIFKRFSPQDQTKVREIMIKMVLATDMFYHAQNMQQMQRIIEKIQFDPQAEISNNQRLICEEELLSNKIFLLGQTLHMADISNPCREWNVCSKWTDLVFREFFYQGDLERQMGLPISALMDRYTINIAQTQVNFINFLVIPVFTEFQKICKNLDPLLRKAQANRQQWEELKEVFEIHKDIQYRSLHKDDLGGFEGNYFSYENYKLRKLIIQQTQMVQPLQAPSHLLHNQKTANAQSPNVEKHIQFNLAVRHNSNQRISQRTSQHNSIVGTKGSILHQNHENSIGVFVLKEENSSQQVSSDSDDSSISQRDSSPLTHSTQQKQAQNQKLSIVTTEQHLNPQVIVSENTTSLLNMNDNPSNNNNIYVDDQQLLTQTKQSYLTKSIEDYNDNDMSQDLELGGEELIEKLNSGLQFAANNDLKNQRKKSTFSKNSNQNIKLFQNQTHLKEKIQTQQISSHRFNLQQDSVYEAQSQQQIHESNINDYIYNSNMNQNQQQHIKGKTNYKQQKIIDISMSNSQDYQEDQNLNDYDYQNSNNMYINDINHKQQSSDIQKEDAFENINSNQQQSPQKLQVVTNAFIGLSRLQQQQQLQQQNIQKQKNTMQKILVNNQTLMMDRSGNLNRY